MSMMKSWRSACFLPAVLLTLSAVLVKAGEGIAAAPDSEATPPGRYRWGVGWDEGIALRANIGRGWGLGLRVNPDLIDFDDERSSSEASTYEWQCMTMRNCRNDYDSQTEAQGTSDVRTFSASLMLFHDRKLGKWLTAGPYAAVNFDRWSYTRSEDSHGEWQSRSEYSFAPQQTSRNEETATVKSRNWERRIGLELGIRPTFRFHERFILETRFGLELGFGRWNESQESVFEQSSDDPGPILVYLEREADVAVAPAGQPSSQGKTESKGSGTRLRAVGERLGSGAELRFVILF
jgi:hypothetical protein